MIGNSKLSCVLSKKNSIKIALDRQAISNTRDVNERMRVYTSRHPTLLVQTSWSNSDEKAALRTASQRSVCLSVCLSLKN